MLRVLRRFRPLPLVSHTRFVNTTAKGSVRDILFRTRDHDPISLICCTGWVKNIRRVGKNVAVFVDLIDGSCSQHLQVVLKPEILADQPKKLTIGSSLVVNGTVVFNERDKKNELVGSSVTITGSCNIQEFPFRPKKEYPAEYTRSFLHLRPRLSSFTAMLRLRSAFYAAVQEFFATQGFIHIHTPIITTNDCEGAGEVFTLLPKMPSTTESKFQRPEKFFGTDAYLTVSAQLHLEAVMCGLSKVYTCNPTFRAENSKSRKHLSEFYMIEAEQAFVNSLDELTDLVEDLIKCVTQKIFSTHEDDVALVTKENNYDSEQIRAKFISSFIKMPYSEAVDILQRKSGMTAIKFGQDLNSEHEKLLVEHCGNTPVFVTHFPSDLKPFYMKRDSKEGKTADCFDLLAPVSGEICGGSLREDDLDVLSERLRNLGLEKSLSWYLDLRRYGSVPHGGFGLGFERYLQSVLGITNIKDAIPFPRWPHHCYL